MKTLELHLNKRLLIVESEEDLLSKKYWYDGEMHLKIELICKGSEFTEEITKGLFEYEQKFDNFNRFIQGYRFRSALYRTSLGAFISAIESKGWYWGENPEGDQPHNTGLVNSYPTGHALMDKSLEESKKWIDAESRTFNPEKCLIFEIL